MDETPALEEEEDEGPSGLTFDECRSFFEFLKHINDIDLAFDFYNYAGTDIDKETMKQVYLIVHY